jgi:hypothetical protein
MDRSDFIEGWGLRARNLEAHEERWTSLASRRKLVLPCPRARGEQDHRKRYGNPAEFEMEHMDLGVMAKVL